MNIIIPLILITISCIVIWRAGDGLMLASRYIGRNLSDGVRGASINAIASSMPEVAISLIFLFVLMDGNGLNGGIGTTAGSAIFNAMVIPAASVMVVIGLGLTNKIKISRKIIFRDGFALLFAEIIFLVLISGSQLDWHHGLILMCVYVLYITNMFVMMRRKKNHESEKTDKIYISNDDEDDDEDEGYTLLRKIITIDFKSIFFKKSVNNANAWALLLTSTMAIASVCYLLVMACVWLSSETYEVPFLGTFSGLNIPLLFVALILASGASSFPDTIISIKDAQRGQYDDAISNVLGSNIFDICFALGFPLFLYTLINGPIALSPEVMDLSLEIRVLLLILTIVVMIVFTVSDTIGKGKGTILLMMYIIFIFYVIGRSSGNEYCESIADQLINFGRMVSIE